MLRKLLTTLMIATVAAGSLPAAPAVTAAGATRFEPASSSRLVLQGSSNVTDWTCSGTTLQGEMTVAAPLDKINAVIDRIEDGNIGVWMSAPEQGRFPPPVFRMRVPVSSFRCGNKVMERDMSRALKADEFPVIEFDFTGLRGQIQHDLDEKNYQARIGGHLTLAGARRDVEITVTTTRVARDRFRITASLPLRMTDFGVDPPTALFGMVKARNELVVKFDLMLQPSIGMKATS